VDALTRALNTSRGKIRLIQEKAIQLKQGSLGGDILGPSTAYGQIGDWTTERVNRQRYGLFRGWLYAAINALASEGAGQPVQVGRYKNVHAEREEERQLSRLTTKAVLNRMTRTARSKAIKTEFELVVDHPLVLLLEQPNPMQGQWQFVYSFIANLCLTGWAYLIGGQGDSGIELYSLPTTWVTPKHDDGPFSMFKIQNPNQSDQSKAVELGRENVAFAHLPNPADPLSAVPPVQSQETAIRVDDHIQTSQERFFENGIFPSVVISVGRDPHPDVPGGVRPRLSGIQRRQIHAAIKRTMGGVANYGEPAIVDGMVESVDRLSATQNEMGWEKSEMSVRTRILSSLGVHPYILGEPVNVGGYAQAAKIEERFCKRVNTYLDMLGNIVTNWAAPLASEGDKLMVWWEECQSSDPALHWQNMRAARQMGDITKNEMRVQLGLPPDESVDDETKSPLAETVGGMTGTVGIMQAVGNGVIPRESAVEMLMLFLQVSREQAEAMVGPEPEKPEIPPQLQPGNFGESDSDDVGDLEDGGDMDEVDELAEAKEVMRLLGVNPEVIAERIVRAAK
jgi:phage portal protein BeeE